MGTGIWNSWGWHWEPYERGTWEILLENLVENDWKPYQETYQQPCWEPQIRNPFTAFHKPKIRNPVGRGVCCEPHSELNGSFSRTFCWELYQEPYRLFGNLAKTIGEPVNNLSSKAPYPNFVGNLKHRTLHFDPIGNPVGNLETPIRNLVGNLKPETRNRELIGNLVGNREASSGKLPRRAPKHLLTAEDRKLWAVGGKMCWKISWGFCWEPCLGTLLKLLRTLLGTFVGNPVWEPCLRTLLETLLGTLLRILLQTQQDSLHRRKTDFWHAPPSASPNLLSSKTLSKTALGTVLGTLFLKSNTSGTLWEPFQPCSKPVGNPVANPVGKPCWEPCWEPCCWEPCLGTLFGNPVRNGVALLGNPVWEPCWERCWNIEPS